MGRGIEEFRRLIVKLVEAVWEERSVLGRVH